MGKLLVGKIPFLNLFPVFHVLQNECDCSGYEFVEGVPSALNRMLREGAIDVSPSSSIEYLRGGDAYSLLEGHCISSSGRVDSILFFSRLPIGELGGQEVYVTGQSETSSGLLHVILRKFYGLHCDIRVSGLPSAEAIEELPAFLAIGDDALRAAGGARSVPGEDAGPGGRLMRVGAGRRFVYDLGELWELFTGVPFVYALWIARADLARQKKALLERFRKDLDFAKDKALGRLPELSRLTGMPMSPGRIAGYWSRISYDLGNGQKEGLRLFEDYLSELGLLRAS